MVSVGTGDAALSWFLDSVRVQAPGWGRSVPLRRFGVCGVLALPLGTFRSGRPPGGRGTSWNSAGRAAAASLAPFFLPLPPTIENKTRNTVGAAVF